MSITAKPVGYIQPVPAPITPNAALASGQKTAITALQTARAAFTASGNATYVGEVNALLAAVDTFLAAMV
jgi:hypothetical protein